jgi:hypothetical protein
MRGQPRKTFSTERLGYLGRVVHGANPRGWLKKIKAHVGEMPHFAQL